MPQLLHMVRITFLVLLIASAPAMAEIYIYQGPNGERLITDRPPPESRDYALLAKRDTVDNVGHILANRPVETGGPMAFRSIINSASRQFRVDPALVEAVIKVESDFNPNAVSKAGATGLMQLMQKTAWHYDVNNRFNPQQNIQGGVAHLRDLLDRYDGELPLVLAAYNAGATAVTRFNGIPPYPETRRYVQKVLKAHNQYKRHRYGSSD